MSASSPSEAHLALDGAIDQRIRDAIDALLARQGSNGSFGLWVGGGDDVWLDSYVTDFLTRARERKFAVPDDGVQARARPACATSSATTTDPSKNGGSDLAYALYVLARNGVAPIGDLRYLADAKLDALDDADRQGADRRGAWRCSATAPAPSASMRRRSPTIAPQPQPDLSAASTTARRLRDAAALVTLASEGGAPRADDRQARSQRVEAARAALRPRPRRRRTPGWCWRRAPWPRTPATCRSMSAARRSQGPLYRTIRAGDLKEPLTRHQYRRRRR